MLSQRSMRRRERCCSSTTTTTRSALSSWLTSTLVQVARVKQNTQTTTMMGAAPAKSSPPRRKFRTKRRRSSWRKSERSSSDFEAYSLTNCWRHRRHPSDYNPKSHPLYFKVSEAMLSLPSSFWATDRAIIFFSALFNQKTFSELFSQINLFRVLFLPFSFVKLPPRHI